MVGGSTTPAPCVDVRLADGTRCHAVLAPVARPGTLVSLRVPHRAGLRLAELVARGRADAVRAGRWSPDRGRGPGLPGQSGGTGSGKTTLLAAMLGDSSTREQRLVLVEDASELRPRHPHVVGLEARPANIEGAGEIMLRDLVRQALRMRPDRLVVGEVRGAEVVDLLAALNTGHEGGCGTVHANSAADVPARVEALALAAGLGREAAHSQFASAIDVVLHLARGRDGRRRLSEVAVPVREPSGLVGMRPAVTFDADGRAVEGPGADRLAERLDERRGCARRAVDRGGEVIDPGGLVAAALAGSGVGLLVPARPARSPTRGWPALVLARVAGATVLALVRPDRRGAGAGAGRGARGGAAAARPASGRGAVRPTGRPGCRRPAR